jgi:hypothetical protein
MYSWPFRLLSPVLEESRRIGVVVSVAVVYLLLPQRDLLRGGYSVQAVVAALLLFGKAADPEMIKLRHGQLIDLHHGLHVLP